MSAIHFSISYLSLIDFHNFPGPAAFFQNFSVLENATVKFQDFPGFSGSVQALYNTDAGADAGFFLGGCAPLRNDVTDGEVKKKN